jgi:hypothetical protein
VDDGKRSKLAWRIFDLILVPPTAWGLPQLCILIKWGPLAHFLWCCVGNCSPKKRSWEVISSEPLIIMMTKVKPERGDTWVFMPPGMRAAFHMLGFVFERALQFMQPRHSWEQRQRWLIWDSVPWGGLWHFLGNLSRLGLGHRGGRHEFLEKFPSLCWSQSRSGEKWK